MNEREQMPELDDAIRFLLDFARDPRDTGDSSYGYEIYLPNVIRAFLSEKDGAQLRGYISDSSEGRAISPVFYEAVWELCRRGIFRPGLKTIGLQATDSGGSGDGYSITAAGRTWLEAADASNFVSTEPSRFAKIAARFRDRLGDGYFQRAQEAARSHFATAYLASCAMSGAAAESILLRVAIAKEADEMQVLRIYRSANGRKRVEDLIVGQLRAPLVSQFKSLMDLLKYWRDEASHGGVSDISEFEAYEAIARLLRLAHFVDDHWDELTSGHVAR